MVKFFKEEEEKQIVDAIQQAERDTTGQICVHLRKKCEKDILVQAQEKFKKMGMHRTKDRNAVLIFVAPIDRKFAIFGDEMIHGKVGQDFWHDTRDLMTTHFKRNQLKSGIIAGIRSVGEKLKEHFPSKTDHPNQLPDTVTED